MRRLALLAGSLVACAHAPPRSSASAAAVTAPGPAAVVEAARGEARALLLAQSEAAWRNWVYGDPLDLAKTYAGHEALFSVETLRAVQALEAVTPDPMDRRALSFLRVYLAGEALGRELAALGDQAAELEVHGTFVGPDGVEHPYRELDRLLASNRDHRARVALAGSVKPVLDKLTALAQARETRTRELLPTLGYPDGLAYGAALRAADLSALAAVADDFLTRTETVYRLAMDRQLRAELGLSLGDARPADLPRFNRAPDLDVYFPADKLLVRLRATLAGLGIDLEHQTNIRIDDAPLPSKNPRSVCLNVEVPADVRLSVKPVGGVTDYQALFHEAGHAESYANSKTARFEFQQLGDRAPAEAYADLFEGLIGNPLWLADQTAPPAATRAAGASNAGAAAPVSQKLAEFVRAGAVKKLFRVRRYAAKLLDEVRGSTLAPGTERRALHQSTLARAYGFPLGEVDAERDLVDRGDFFSAADEFRGWVLAAQLEAKLAKDHGQRWWTQRTAGELLRSLWSEGSGPTVDEIAVRLEPPGGSGLQLEPLLAEFEAALR